MANQHTYSDIDLRFTANPVTGDIAYSFDEQAVIRSVRNLISTRPYDRLWQPEIDPGIDALLFEPISSLSASHLEDEIFRVIKNFEPRASVAKVTVSPVPEKNSYTVNLAFYINNSLTPTAINVILQRAR
jgi:phage baseplate assembly protein W